MRVSRRRSAGSWVTQGVGQPEHGAVVERLRLRSRGAVRGYRAGGLWRDGGRLGWLPGTPSPPPMAGSPRPGLLLGATWGWCSGCPRPGLRAPVAARLHGRRLRAGPRAQVAELGTPAEPESKSKNLVNAVQPLIEALGLSLLRAFVVDVMKCPRYGSSLRILSVITQPRCHRGILHHLDLPIAPPSSSRFSYSRISMMQGPPRSRTSAIWLPCYTKR
jgi:hypothetical protein